jgi:hypothetical protein
VAEVTAAVAADPVAVRAVLSEVGQRFHDVTVVANREAERRAELDALGAPTISLPSLDHDVTDLPGLVELGGYLRGR